MDSTHPIQPNELHKRVWSGHVMPRRTCIHFLHAKHGWMVLATTWLHGSMPGACMTPHVVTVNMNMPSLPQGQRWALTMENDTLVNLWGHSIAIHERGWLWMAKVDCTHPGEYHSDSLKQSTRSFNSYPWKGWLNRFERQGRLHSPWRVPLWLTQTIYELIQWKGQLNRFEWQGGIALSPVKWGKCVPPADAIFTAGP